jgi:hypothetical protein
VSAPPPAPVDSAPAGAVTPAGFRHVAPGARVDVVAYFWGDKPSCPPCPAGRLCEPCPIPHYHFAERRHERLGDRPGDVVFVEFDGGAPPLNVRDRYVLTGRARAVRDADAERVVLFVERVATLPPTAPAPAAPSP